MYTTRDVCLICGPLPLKMGLDVRIGQLGAQKRHSKKSFFPPLVQPPLVFPFTPILNLSLGLLCDQNNQKVGTADETSEFWLGAAQI